MPALTKCTKAQKELFDLTIPLNESITEIRFKMTGSEYPSLNESSFFIDFCMAVLLKEN